MQVVIAQQGHRAASLDQGLDRAQRGERLRPAVD
jgi:hypothetical protein